MLNVFESQRTVCACSAVRATAEGNVKGIKYKKAIVIRNEGAVRRETFVRSAIEMPKKPRLHQDANVMSILYRTICPEEKSRNGCKQHLVQARQDREIGKRSLFR